jgi:chorismate mutase/prephenate dehydratase
MVESLTDKLRPLREQIDLIDRQILELLTQRARTAQAVGKLKQTDCADGQVLQPDRESEVIRQLQHRNPGPLTEEAVAMIWTQIMSACRSLQHDVVLAFLGPEGSYSEQAALAHFGGMVTKLACVSLDEVFHVLETKQADVGMVPVENSTEGAVNRTLDLLLNTSLTVVGERSLLIRHCLLSHSGSLDSVKTIMAHPQALAQCQRWLNDNYPQLARVAVASNSEAARLAAEDATVAAIAGEPAAIRWGLHRVAVGIQDDPYNQTRFLALGHTAPRPTGHDKTSLILAVPNRAGAVYEMLAPFAANRVSMTRFESRPTRTGQWEYYFYVDVLGHAQEPHVARAFEALRARTAFFKVLGSYPIQ